MSKNISPELLYVLRGTFKGNFMNYWKFHFGYNLTSPKLLSFLFFSGQPPLLKEMPGWPTITLPSKSFPETQSMALLCSLGISWPLSTLTVAPAHGCTTALTFTLEVAGQTTSFRVQLKTFPQASRSSRSCEAHASTSKHDEKLVADFSYNISKAFMGWVRRGGANG